MFEVTDVVVAGVVSTVVSLIAYSSIKKDLNSTSTGLTDKKKSEGNRALQKENFGSMRLIQRHWGLACSCYLSLMHQPICLTFHFGLD